MPSALANATLNLVAGQLRHDQPLAELAGDNQVSASTARRWDRAGSCWAPASRSAGACAV